MSEKKTFAEIVHMNRDENSFTARLFESVLFPSWYDDNNSFIEFLDILKVKTIENKNKFVIHELKQWDYENKLTFKEGMLFLEIYDVFAYYVNNNKFFNKLEKETDRTELDCVIVCEDENGKEQIIVFEVKCYNDFDPKELYRQNEWLCELREAGLYHDFHHFALIAYDNLKNARTAFNNDLVRGCNNGVYIITWDDVKQYLQHPRFRMESLYMFKKIKRDGSGETKRSLVNMKDRK